MLLLRTGNALLGGKCHLYDESSDSNAMVTKVTSQSTGYKIKPKFVKLRISIIDPVKIVTLLSNNNCKITNNLFR